MRRRSGSLGLAVLGVASVLLGACVGSIGGDPEGKKGKGGPGENPNGCPGCTDTGVQILDVYAGPEGVLTGAARLTQEAREKAELTARRQEIERKRRDIERRRQVREAQIAALKAESDAEEVPLEG